MLVAIHPSHSGFRAIHKIGTIQASSAIIRGIPVNCWTIVMNSFWRFLRDRRNQPVLGWLGAGLVVVPTGVGWPLSISLHRRIMIVAA
jgi:hypothetical protein